MLSIGIIWNSVNFYSEDIIQDTREKMNLLGAITLDLENNYFDFVREVYKSEKMEEWKIENKINYMSLNSSRSITILFFEFDESKTEYHPFKHKEVFEELENFKKYIREKYKQNVENYTFDIIFHATDNLLELRSCFDVVKTYIENNNVLQNSNPKILKISKHKDLSESGD